MATTPPPAPDPHSRRSRDDGGIFAWIGAIFSGGKSPPDAATDTSAGPDSAGGERAEAAVLLAEGRATEAAAKARAGLHALAHKSLSPVISPFER